MNNWRKHRADCGADESMHVHSEQRRSSQSKTFHVSTALTLLPPRPRSYGDTRLSSRGSEHLGLQVQGFCCPLQQRPDSGRVTHRVIPQSREGGHGRLTLLSSLRGRLETRAKVASRARTGSKAELTPEHGAAVCVHRDPDDETAETPTAPCSHERRAHHMQSSAKKASALHLYLPSSLYEDEEQDAEADHMRPPAEKPDVKPKEAGSPAFPNPSRDQSNEALNSTPQAPSDDVTPEQNS
ncbi:uncharacterized protein LOC113138341 isoform X2 [Mastacembelus armatus]|uniref:uncharacterized protein LOC113138341 isoform X2 n=1 Tax=Mastacembelus armatus TaxID=205130 RepID=UPI000E45C511|nr:uncharacterized protein LOC113138341 isoform X2 [Mastacembelus armatus]